MQAESHGEQAPDELLRRSIEHDRIHAAYLLTGPGEAPVASALAFGRALVCAQGRGLACEQCDGCRRSEPGDEPIALDGKGRRGPTFRRVGDHPDLFWVERGADDTRITIGQIRDLQAALRLGANEGGRRCAVIAGAEWLNVHAQNALLRILEEPPPGASLVLVASRASAILPTIRSRSVRVRFPTPREPGLRDPETPESIAGLVRTLDELTERPIGELLDLAESYRGARATAAEAATELIDVAASWLHEDVRERVERGEAPGARRLDAYHGLQQLRRDLIQRNANPQMVAERLLLGLRDAAAG